MVRVDAHSCPLSSQASAWNDETRRSNGSPLGPYFGSCFSFIMGFRLRFWLLLGLLALASPLSWASGFGSGFSRSFGSFRPWPVSPPWFFFFLKEVLHMLGAPGVFCLGVMCLLCGCYALVYGSRGVPVCMAGLCELNRMFSVGCNCVGIC